MKLKSGFIAKRMLAGIFTAVMIFHWPAVLCSATAKRPMPTM